MENLKMFKKLVIVMLSLMLIAVCSTNVFAADDDLFMSVDNNTAGNNSAVNDLLTNNVTNEADNNTTNGSLTANNTATNNNVTNNTIRNTTNNTSNTVNTNANRNASNTLAKTGLSNTNGIVALVLVVCAVSAIYSYKKVNDYKKL